MKPEKQLYQWDVNQYLTGINPAAQYVDYTIGNEVIRIKADGTRCRIPDELLQTDDEKTCYERYQGGTYRAYSFTVLYAPKPPDYVYTPEERTTFEALTDRVDSAIEEIKRRADSGEFTPKKGVDYFTDAEKSEMMESVSDGAIGEFREVVDTATTDYNRNAAEKLEAYNSNHATRLTAYDTNAEQHTTDYNANATEKLTTYNRNAEQKLEAYNSNHATRLTAYDTNAEQHTTDYNANATEKLTTYNRNAEQKLESYNSNHTEKLTEYNTNAETKTAEFDLNAAALQTEVDRLRGECDQLAEENRKQENRISALLKLNKGQTYDILPEEGESAIRTAPSGAKYVSVDKVGGKSVVWNQLVDGSNLPKTITINGITFTNNGDGSITVDGTATDNANINLQRMDNKTIIGHKYLMLGGAAGGSISTYFYRYDSNGGTQAYDYGNGAIFIKTAEGITYITIRVLSGVTVSGLTFKPQLVDMTLMFGAGNEPTAEQFERMFPAESYPYNPGEIISSRTATITAGAETITTGFPELRSAGTAHDVIDLDGGQATRNVYTVELETLVWRRSDNRFYAVLPAKAKANGNYNTTNNELCSKYESIPMNDIYNGNVGIATHPINGETVWLFDSAYETTEQLVASLSGAVLQYELETPTTEQVTIPEPLQEWLSVEPGGTVTFRNSDETKQLAVPNAVSWVRKLDEVN